MRYSPKKYSVKIYLSSFAAVLFVILGIVSLGNLTASVLLFIAGGAQMLWLRNMNGSTRYRFLLSVVFVSSMIVFSSLLRIVPGNLDVRNLSLLVGSILDDVSPAGVPLLFGGGIVIYGSISLITISLQYLAIIALLGGLVPENFYLIWRILSNGSSPGGIRSLGRTPQQLLTTGGVILSCQCEGIVAAAPAIASLLVGLLILPLISEATLLILLSNVLFSLALRKGADFIGKIRNAIGGSSTITGVVLLVLLIPTSITGAALGWETSIYYFFGLNSLMFLAGSMVGYASLRKSEIRIRGFLSILFVLFLSMLMMFAWFIPSVSLLAYNSYLIYSGMEVFSILAGILAALAFHSTNSKGKLLILETIAMMFPVVSLVVMTYSVVSIVPIWSEFSPDSQLPFAIILLMLSLPVLWLTTILSVIPERGLNAGGTIHEARTAKE